MSQKERCSTNITLKDVKKLTEKSVQSDVCVNMCPAATEVCHSFRARQLRDQEELKVLPESPVKERNTEETRIKKPSDKGESEELEFKSRKFQATERTNGEEPRRWRRF